MPMSGALDRKVTIQRYSMTLNDDLEPIEVWTPDEAPFHASWRRASARETLAGGEVNAAATDIFEVRYWTNTANIDPKDRLSYQGDVYDIQSTQEIDRREGVRIEATKRADL